LNRYREHRPPRVTSPSKRCSIEALIGRQVAGKAVLDID
jgi:hypothetical protein